MPWFNFTLNLKSISQLTINPITFIHQENWPDGNMPSMKPSKPLIHWKIWSDYGLMRLWDCSKTDWFWMSKNNGVKNSLMKSHLNTSHHLIITPFKDPFFLQIIWPKITSLLIKINLNVILKQDLRFSTNNSSTFQLLSSMKFWNTFSESTEC